ncbi:MAG: amidohydrolase [Candidatus Riflebacteria bacterium]|nr:amidohydrolase [Candidatus Riflebacteria bacterium]
MSQGNMKNIFRMNFAIGCFLCTAVLMAQSNDYVATEQIVSKFVSQIEPSIIEFRRDLHMNPELSNRESRTSKVIAEKLRTLGFDEVKTGVASTGIVAILRGGKPGPVVAYRADMDALPIQETRSVPYKSRNPGVMHACGHDVHVSIALGIAETLSKIKDQITGTVKFIFQPAEEGAPDGEEGGAGQMIKEGALENPRPKAIFGCHVESEIPVGKICLISGPTMASSDDLYIEILGKSAHGAKPHDGIDSIVVSANVINALQVIRSRRIDPREGFVLTIGKIQGGTRSNIIPEKVEMTGTIRTLSEKIRKEVPGLVRQTVEGVCSAFGASCSVKINKDYPVTFNDPKLAEEILPLLKKIISSENLFTIKPHTGAEDFSKYQKVIPGLFFFIGIANMKKNINSAIHTSDFDVDETCLAASTRAMSLLLLEYLKNNKI